MIIISKQWESALKEKRVYYNSIWLEEKFLEYSVKVCDEFKQALILQN